MKLLPIAKTEISEIVKTNCLYVDKTMFIKSLLDENHGYYFLARPRRFGKSLLVDTMRAAFAGEQELFKGLYIENNWDWSVHYPVLKISFGAGTVSSKEELTQRINEILYDNSVPFGIDLVHKTLSGKFKKLIESLKHKYNQNVVVLIDEYDKPILDNITKDNVAEIREELSSFYSVLKDASEFLKFVFITGVSKFSKTSIFSKLNNLTDISLNKKYADICGITQVDLERVFVDYLKDVNLKKLKQWYDGYNFRGNNLYNPYDVLMFLWEKSYKPYWFQTGTPTFLLELIKERKFFVPSLNYVKVYETQLEEFDLNYIDLEVLLFQSGYLTIKEERNIGVRTQFVLSIPNQEVKIGLTDYLLRTLYAPEVSANNRTEVSETIYFAIAENNPQALESAFKSFFASIPHAWYVKNDIARFEGFYTSLFYAFFAAQGFVIIPEDFTNRGRIDMTIVTESSVFIFEFKMNHHKENALQQIKNRKYYEKYQTQNKTIYLVGIEFNEEEKNISVFECETM